MTAETAGTSDTGALAEVLAAHVYQGCNGYAAPPYGICTCGWSFEIVDGTDEFAMWADHVALHIRQARAGEGALRERIAGDIERRRNEHWQQHLREHPYANARSCPGDYAAHDAYADAANIARAALTDGAPT